MNKKLTALLAAAGMSFSAGLMAATDGLVATGGDSSVGNVDITLQIPQLIQLLVGPDIDLGSYSGDGNDMTGTTTACVRANVAQYTVTATSTEGDANTAFELSDGANAIPYSVTWDGAGALGYNTPSAALPRDNAAGFQACTLAAGRISVTVTGANLDAADAGSYQDTLILSVEPQ